MFTKGILRITAATIAFLIIFPAMADDDDRRQVDISKVLTDTNSQELYIYGQYFSPHGQAPLVSLEQTLSAPGIQLQVTSHTNSQITAQLPTNILAGNYRLTVDVISASDDDDDDNKRAATFDLTIGAIGPQGEKGDAGSVQLACITAYMRAGKDSPGYIRITSQRGYKVSNWTDVFVPNIYTGGQDHWGLSCNNDWVNTGCSQARLRGQGTVEDGGVDQGKNGCFSDNEELWEQARVYTTCCKITDK